MINLIADKKYKSTFIMVTKVLIAVIIVVINSHQVRADVLESWQSCCGAACLRTVAGILGDETELAEIRELLEPNNRGETSLAEISKTAKKIGFYAVGLRIKSEKLSECSLPLIAHKEPNHFVVLLGLGKDKDVILIDPPYNPQKIPLEKFIDKQEYWNVVAISKHPIDIKGLNKENKNDEIQKKDNSSVIGGLRFDSTIWNFGTMRPGSEKSYEFSIENISKKDIIISTVKVNCACLDVLDYTEKIVPGQKGKISITINTEDMHGYITKEILCIIKNTSTGTEEQLQLKVLGEVSKRGELICKPSEIYLSDIVKGSQISKNIVIRRIGYDKLYLKEVESDSNNVIVKVINGLEEDVYEANIDIKYEAKESIGSFEHKVVIETDFPEYPTANLRIYGNVVPHINIEPKEALFSLISEQSVREKYINLKSKTDKPYTIQKVEVTTDDVEAECKFIKDDKTEWQIKLTLSQAIKKGIFKGKVILTTDDSELPIIEIPYTGLVTDK